MVAIAARRHDRRQHFFEHPLLKSLRAWKRADDEPQPVGPTQRADLLNAGSGLKGGPNRIPLAVIPHGLPGVHVAQPAGHIVADQTRVAIYLTMRTSQASRLTAKVPRPTQGSTRSWLRWQRFPRPRGDRPRQGFGSGHPVGQKEEGRREPPRPDKVGGSSAGRSVQDERVLQAGLAGHADGLRH